MFLGHDRSGSIPNKCCGISGSDKVEIIDLINPKSNFSFNYDKLASMHASNCGGFIQGEPIICGGYSFINKRTFKNVIALQQPNQNNGKLLIERVWGVASVVLKLKDVETLWITGGNVKTTEFVSVGQPPTKGPNLPFFALGHTMEYVDLNKIMIIVGYQNGKNSNKTWFIDPTND